MNRRKINPLYILCLPVLLMATKSKSQYLPANYANGNYVNSIRTWDVKKPITDLATVLTVTNPAEVMMSTQYIDGLGRPLQTVVKQMSPLLKDMVTANIYDPLGRESEKYMPFVSTANDGAFKTNPFAQQKTFYDAYLTGQSQTWYYDSINFEKSPLNRPLKTMAAGNSWVGASRGVSQNIQMNAASEVRLWNMATTSAGVPTSTAWYAAGELYRLVTTDEHGKRVVEYKNKEGLVILKKVEIATSAATITSHTGWLCTYYIYDYYNDLRWVIQPVGVEQLSSASWVFDNTQLYTSIIAKEQCFYYEYDGRKRMIVKKVPGAFKVEMVYDKRDRLVLTRDSSLASQGYWMVNKYDHLNRLSQTGLLSNSFTRTRHQDSCNNNINYPSSVGSVLQENYYDNYDWVTSPTPQAGIASTLYTFDLGVSSYYYQTPNVSPYYAQQIAADYNVSGKLTGTKVSVLGTVTFLHSVNFYDAEGRLIQTRSANISSGDDVITTQYDFAGRPLVVGHLQNKGFPVARFMRERSRIVYDHAGRVSTVYRRISTLAEKTLVTNTYDELGRLKTKALGSNIETQAYDYNVRGWLLGANRSMLNTSDPTSKFAYELGYDNITPKLPGSDNYGAASYNGNICGMLWRSAGDGENRKYNFSYDNANRLLNAEFKQYTGGSYNTSAGIDFTSTMGDGVTPGSAYDANGNILAMTQKGFKFNGSSVIDKLTYGYLSGSNKLATVTDTAAATSKLGDFNDGSKVGDDYTYDVNGNLKTDKNKAITSILYTHLNQPYEVTITGKGTITYQYDNLGNKLKKTVVDNTVSPAKTTTWMYLKNMVYKNDTLEYFTHEEGRARYDSTEGTGEAKKFDFDYFVKDHLGNVRMVLTEQKDTVPYTTLSFEDADIAAQNKIWENKTGGSINVATIRNSRPAIFGNVGSNGSYAHLIRKSTGPIGAGKLLKVMAGDRIHTQVDYFYIVTNANNTGASGINSLITNFATSILASGQVSAALKDGASAITSSLSSDIPFTNLLNTPNNTSGANNAPKAYLNILFFDEQFRADNNATTVVPVPYTPGVKGTINKMLANAVTAKKNGYVYVYFSNESDEIVYYDNFMLSHELGPIREETHYYPFGLTMAGISSRALGKLENKYKFNDGTELANKEFSDGSGLELYETRYRTLDPQVGRFLQVDPLAEMTYNFSLYAYANNNPIFFNDPLGLLSDSASPQVLEPVVVSAKKKEPQSVVQIHILTKLGNDESDNLLEFGHTAIRIGNDFYGYYPRESYFGGRARLRKDDLKLFSTLNQNREASYFQLNLTPEQTEKLKNILEDYMRNPGKYNLLGQQCTSVAIDALIQSGVEIKTQTLKSDGLPVAIPIGSGQFSSPNELKTILNYPMNKVLVAKSLNYIIGK